MSTKAKTKKKQKTAPRKAPGLGKHKPPKRTKKKDANGPHGDVWQRRTKRADQTVPGSTIPGKGYYDSEGRPYTNDSTSRMPIDPKSTGSLTGTMNTSPERMQPGKKLPPVTGSNTKRAVSQIVVQWPDNFLGDGFAKLVQEGVSPDDTAIRLRCKRCQVVEEILAKDALAISKDDPPVGMPLEVFNEWCRKMKKKHKRCGGHVTRGTQQSLGMFEAIQ